MVVYDEYQPTIADRSRWTFANIMADRVASHGDRVYLDVPSTGETYTYAKCADMAARVASGLLARGLKPGDRLMFMMPNSSAFMFSWMATSLAGIVQVPINTAYRGAFLEHQVRTTGPVMAIITAEFAERLVESREACQSISRVFMVDESAEAERALQAAGYAVERFDALLAADKVTLPVPKPTELSGIFFTSGTTGLSKGVMMPQSHIFFFADSVVSMCRITDQDVHMSMGPLFHGNAQFMAAYPAFIAGARYVMREKFSASNWSRWLAESGVTVTNFLGAMMDWVWKTPPDPIDSQNQLRCLFSAPTASSIMEGFRQRFGVKEFVEVFGLTETSPMILSPYGMPRPAGSAGARSTWYDIRLVDPDTDEEVPVGQVGELCIRANYPWTTCQGYYGMPEKSLEMFRNCWLHTGDGLKRDENGWYFFVDRLKDAIRRVGENISSYEVEQAVLGHPAIAECSAVGVPADAEAGEDEVMVCMVLVPGEKLSPEEAWAWCDKRLPKFASPRYVAFLTALPATPSGKIRKAALRELKPEQRHDRGASLRKPRGRQA